MVDPIAFSIFGLDVRWYGLAYAGAFLFGYWFIMHFARDFGLKKEHMEDAFLYYMIFSVIGGRIFYILFYNLGFYIENPLKLFAVWEGGMSIHGGILFGALSLMHTAKKHNMDTLRLIDLFSIPSVLGLAFGRLANFVNQELVGKVTTSSFGMVFPNYDNKLRHPSTLYESVKNMITFQILLYMQFFMKLKAGMITAWFLILYSFGRLVVDFAREPTVEIVAGFGMGQLLSIIYGIAGIVLLIKIMKKD